MADVSATTSLTDQTWASPATRDMPSSGQWRGLAWAVASGLAWHLSATVRLLIVLSGLHTAMCIMCWPYTCWSYTRIGVLLYLSNNERLVHETFSCTIDKCTFFSFCDNYKLSKAAEHHFCLEGNLNNYSTKFWSWFKFVVKFQWSLSSLQCVPAGILAPLTTASEPEMCLTSAVKSTSSVTRDTLCKETHGWRARLRQDGQVLHPSVKVPQIHKPGQGSARVAPYSKRIKPFA